MERFSNCSWNAITVRMAVRSHLESLNGLRCFTLIRSKPTHEKQDEENDQDDADDTDAAVTEAVAVAAEAATEATQQEDDKDDDEYESNRHDLSPVAAPNRTLSLFALGL